MASRDSAFSRSGEDREAVGRRKDGTEVPLELRAAVIQPVEGTAVEILWSIVDVSERKRNEASLRLERAFLRQVIDIHPDLIFAKDRLGRFTLANQAMADVYGTTVDALIGKRDCDFNGNAEEVEAFQRADLEVLDTLRDKVVLEERITDATGKALLPADGEAANHGARRHREAGTWYCDGCQRAQDG
jgi:PAS domain S-box-containing protein